MQLEEKIVNLFKSEKFDELGKLLSSESTDAIVSAILKIDRALLAEIFPKFPQEISAEIFVLLPVDLQKYLTENISDFEFKNISEEILDNNDEQKLNPEIKIEVLRMAETDTRHEKLLEIIDKIGNKNFSELKSLLAEMEAVDIAKLINDVSDENGLIIFRLLPKDLASDTFVEMDSKKQEILVKTFTDKELSSIIDDLFVDDTLDIIEEMPSNLVVRILRVTNKETRDMINKLLSFPKDSAGTIMTTEFVTLRPWMTVEEAFSKIRKQALDKETIYTCYVTDELRHLLGIVSAKDLILHDPKDKIKDFMEENFISAHTLTDKEEVSKLLSKYDLLAIPIVDSENRINGIVTIDDAVDVIQDETSEDISKMAAIVPTSKPYLQISVFAIFKSRVPWLLILLISATFTGLIINTYEATLNSLSPLLFACIPMLMDTGGNSGSQASVTIIRSLALNEVEFKDILRVIWKEIRVAILLALVLSVCCFAKLQLIDKLIFGYNYTLKISFVVSISLFFTICIAKMVGACLPLLAKKCRLDPAVVASPFITTIVDAISLIIFCGIAVALL